MLKWATWGLAMRRRGAVRGPCEWGF